MRTIQIRLTQKMLDRIDELVEMGEYPNRSEAVRDAVRILINSKIFPSEISKVSNKDLKKFIKEED